MILPVDFEEKTKEVKNQDETLQKMGTGIPTYVPEDVNTKEKETTNLSELATNYLNQILDWRK